VLNYVKASPIGSKIKQARLIFLTVTGGTLSKQNLVTDEGNVFQSWPSELVPLKNNQAAFVLGGRYDEIATAWSESQQHDIELS
jgi:hypothetical protein